MNPSKMFKFFLTCIFLLSATQAYALLTPITPSSDTPWTGTQTSNSEIEDAIDTILGVTDFSW